MEISNAEKYTAINYIKAITIILMVASHYSSAPLNRLVPFIYHMPLFFFLGGVLFNHAKPFKNHYKNVFLKHFVYIILTYVIVGLLALSIHHFTNTPVGVIFDTSIYSTINKTLNSGFSNNRYFLASWFLFAYMIIMIFAPFICRLIQASPFPLVTGIAFASLIGWTGIDITSEHYYQTKNIVFNYLSQSLVGGMFFIIGFSLKKYIFNLLNELTFSIVIILTIILYGKGIINEMFMSWSVYKLGFSFSLLGAMLGIYCIFYISTVLAKTVSFKWLEFIGEGSKDIMAYHLVTFALLNIIAWRFYNFDIANKDIMHSFSNEWSWIPYIAFGVTVPLFVTKLYKKINNYALLFRRSVQN